MRKSVAVIAATALVASALAVGTAGARSHEEINGTVATILGADPGFSTFLSLSRTAGLADVLSDPRAYVTAFAPTNAAFRKLEKAAPGVTQALVDPRNRKLLVDLLKHHLSRQRLNSITLREIAGRKGKIPTLLGGTANGKLAVGLKAFTFTLTDSAGLDTATATEPDVASDNGGIHVIDKVLVPRSVAVALRKSGLLG